MLAINYVLLNCSILLTYLASQLLSYQEQVDGVRLMHNQCRNVKLSATLSYQEQKKNGMRLQLLATPGI